MRKNLFILALCFLIGVALYPFESQVVPEWKVRVIDVNGVSCANMPVTEMWGHYSLFLNGDFRSADRLTDSEGFAKFPERHVRAIGIRRLIMPFVTEVLTYAHGSTGVDGAVSASGLKDVAWLSYEVDQPLPDTARVEKCIAQADLQPKESSKTTTEEPVSFDLLADRLNLPRPEDFPIPEQEMFKGTPAPAKIIQQQAKTYRSVISDGAARGPNFAGHYTIVTWGAGMGSFSVAVVDARDGRVFFMPFESIGRAGYGLNFEGEGEMNPAFRLDSNLLAFSGCPGKEYEGCSDWDKLGFYIYKFENERFTLLRFVKQEEFENALK